jgi:multidrug efflux pump subunit AcrA (membrane-fusion protein)
MPKKKRFPTWMVILLGIVAIAAIGGVGVALSGGDEVDSEGQEPKEPVNTASPSPKPAGVTVELVVDYDWGAVSLSG